MLHIVAAALALYFARPIMVPFVLALFIRLLIDPIIDFQIKYLRVHQWLAILVSVFLIVGFFIIIIPFIINSVTTFLRSADDLEDTIVDIVTKGSLTNLSEFTLSPISRLISRLRSEKPIGRMVVDLDFLSLKNQPAMNFRVQDGDELFVPQSGNVDFLQIDTEGFDFEVINHD